MAKTPAHTCWVISDGRAGMENQALGLAEAVARQIPLSISTRRIGVHPIFAKLPAITWGNPFSKLTHVTTPSNEASSLTAPFPDLWIACGRLTVPFSMAVKKTGQSFVVQTQTPHAPIEKFDLIVPPIHDHLEGENVFAIHGAPNRITPQLLAHDAKLLPPYLTHLSKPLVAVLIGGTSKAYKLNAASLSHIISQLKAVLANGFSLMITVSRRTAPQFQTRLRDALIGPEVFFWNGSPLGDLANPYFAMLALATHIIVTEESTNMITEAATTGKPVHLLSLAGGNQKFHDFHQSLTEQNITRPLQLPLQEWAYAPLQETDKAATALLQRWAAQ